QKSSNFVVCGLKRTWTVDSFTGARKPDKYNPIRLQAGLGGHMEWRTRLRPAIVFACAYVVAACDSSTKAESSEALRNEVAVTIAGSVGDGPAVGADLMILDADGAVVVGGTSDSTAGYRIEVPPNTK